MKTKRYWLSGGVSGLIIGVLLLTIIIVAGLSVHEIGMYGIVPQKIFKFILNILLIQPLENQGFSFLESAIISLAYSAIAGSIIGYVYGKIKNRK